MFNFVYKSIDFSHKIDRPSVPSENYEKHMHYFNEILFFVAGDVDYTVENETFKLSPGDLLIIPSGKFHFASVNLSVPYERYVLKFPDSILSNHLIDKKNSLPTIFNEMKKFILLFENLEDYFNRNADRDDVYELFISELMKILVFVGHEKSNPISRKNDTITSIINYIDANIHNKITLDSIAESFNFSKSYISNEFKKYMRTPIMQYVRSKKIIAAHLMILNGAKKTEAAEAFGFDTYSTFYREYVKIMGFAPNGEASKSRALTKDNDR